MLHVVLMHLGLWKILMNLRDLRGQMSGDGPTQVGDLPEDITLRM